jgi:hypothetical protein
MEEVRMGQKTLLVAEQHALPFTRHERWQSLPVQQRRQCCELCEQLLRAVLQDEEGEGREVNDGREDQR